MNTMTETEAREKWCPMARIRNDDEGGSYNRWITTRDPNGHEGTAYCIASQCMAFRWSPDFILLLSSGHEIRLDMIDQHIANLGGWWWDGRYTKGAQGYLHRIIVGQILGEIPDGMFVDHIDGDPTNNRRGNLRVVTKAENAANAAARGGKSQYRGVSQAASGRWVSQISKAGVRVCLGTYDTEEAAAAAYDAAAKTIHGVHARSNLDPIKNSGRRGYCGAFGRPDE